VPCERLILAAIQLAVVVRAFDDAPAYGKQHKRFGRPIGSFQALKQRVADLVTELEAARLMTYWVASTVDEDEDRMLPKEASMVKLFVTELCERVTLEGTRRMVGSTIYDGTSEIQRGIIAKTLGL
jgi:alkylation response protein AidB-like acyl-CoA dehydrogenase